MQGPHQQQQQQPQWQQYSQQPYVQNPWAPPGAPPAPLSPPAQPQQTAFYVPTAAAAQQQGFVPTSVPAQHAFVPPSMPPHQQQQPGQGAPGLDPFVTGLAGSMLQAQGRSYLARGQALLQVGQRWGPAVAAIAGRVQSRTPGASPPAVLLLPALFSPSQLHSAPPSSSQPPHRSPPSCRPHTSCLHPHTPPPCLQSRMSFLNGSLLHYQFSVTPEYVRSKLLMLLAPFLRRWSYARAPEQLSGGYKYLPPRQDVNAPGARTGRGGVGGGVGWGVRCVTPAAWQAGDGCAARAAGLVWYVLGWQAAPSPTLSWPAAPLPSSAAVPSTTVNPPATCSVYRPDPMPAA